MKRIIVAALLKILSSYWLSAHFRTKAGNTILHIAAKYRYFMVARCVLLLSANPNAINNNSDTPLHLAVKYGHKSMCPVLNACKVDDDPLDTPYDEVPAKVSDNFPEYSIPQDSDDCQNQLITLLLSYGADIQFRNTHSMSPVDYALLYANTAVAKRFIMLNARLAFERLESVIDSTTRANDILLWILVSISQCEYLCIYSTDTKLLMNNYCYAIDLNLWNSVMYLLFINAIIRSPDLPMQLFSLLSHYVSFRQYHDFQVPILKLKYENK